MLVYNKSSSANIVFMPYKVEYEVLFDGGLSLWNLGCNVFIDQIEVGAFAQDHIVLPLNHI